MYFSQYSYNYFFLNSLNYYHYLFSRIKFSLKLKHVHILLNILKNKTHIRSVIKINYFQNKLLSLIAKYISIANILNSTLSVSISLSFG